MKLSTTILSLTAGATLAFAPQLAQAQNSIAITGGKVDDSGDFSLTLTTSSQGTFNGVSSINTVSVRPCVSGGCIVEIYTAVSGSGFSPAGPVLFSNVPVVLQSNNVLTAGGTATILSGAFNSTTVINGDQSQSVIDSVFNSDGVAGPLSSPDFSVGQFHFNDANFNTVTANTQNFTIAESLTGFNETELDELEEIVGEDGPNASRPEGRVFRPNGMHTRIIPAWTPGLYQ